jgi:hypothetical protein
VLRVLALLLMGLTLLAGFALTPAPQKAEPDPPTPAPNVPEAESIDALLERLAELKTKRLELERLEKEAIKALEERLRDQAVRIQALGLKPAEGTKAAEPSKPAPAPPDPWSVAALQDQATAAELRTLAGVLSNAADALERARPPTVGHVKSGLDVVLGARLKGRLPAVTALVRQRLKEQLPADSTSLTTQVGTAVKLVLVEIATILETLAKGATP